MIAVLALTAQTQSSAVQLTRWTPPLAEVALVAPRTFVHRVRHEQPLTLELLAKDDRIHAGQLLVTQPIGELLAGRLAIDRATAGEVRTEPAR